MSRKEKGGWASRKRAVGFQEAVDVKKLHSLACCAREMVFVTSVACMVRAYLQ